MRRIALGLEIGRRDGGPNCARSPTGWGPRCREEFLGLAALLRWVEGGGDWPKITSEHPAYFYTLRAQAAGRTAIW